MATSPSNLYRSIMREVRLGDSIHKFRHHRGKSVVVKNLRQTLEERLQSPKQSEQKLSQLEEKAQKARMYEMVEVGRYLQARRLHMMLVERYNAGVNMTQEERARLSARRVGLNMPEMYGTANQREVPGSTEPEKQ